MQDGPLLDERTVLEYLDERGTLTTTGVTARELTGGVSNVALAVGSAPEGYVVKQCLGRLKVADEWLAPRERILAEAAALRLAAELTPGAVPDVVDVDADRFVMTIRLAPEDWADWRARLFDGRIETATGRRLGEVLARWHSGTPGGVGLPESIRSDTHSFEALRIAPYHETVAARHPEVARPIRDVVDRMRNDRLCMVHGDFSPKNILVGSSAGEDVWVIDFEVAHVGDPSFDLAFLLSHLVMKAVHRPDRGVDLDAAAAAFIDAYARGAQLPSTDHLGRQVGCLLLARVDGKSPAGYLDAGQRRIVWDLGVDLLLDNPLGEISDLPLRRRRQMR